MKIFIISLLFLIGCASAVPLVEKSSIIELPGMSKQQIYQKSMQWITYKFVSGRAVMDYKDPDMGKIIAKGSMEVGRGQLVYMVSTIDCISGKAKIAIEPQGCQYLSYGRPIDCPCDGHYFFPSALKAIPVKINNFIEDYKLYMTVGKSAAWDGK